MKDAFHTDTLILLWLLLAFAIGSTVDQIQLNPAIFTVDNRETP